MYSHVNAFKRYRASATPPLPPSQVLHRSFLNFFLLSEDVHGHACVSYIILRLFFSLFQTFFVLRCYHCLYYTDGNLVHITTPDLQFYTDLLKRCMCLSYRGQKIIQDMHILFVCCGFLFIYLIPRSMFGTYSTL